MSTNFYIKYLQEFFSGVRIRVRRDLPVLDQNLREYKLRRRSYQIKVERQYQDSLHIRRAVSSSFEGSGSSGNTNQPWERENNVTRMDPKFYGAAAKGDIEIFKVPGTDLNVLLTPNKNTVLHIYITALVAEAESPTNFLDEVLKIHPSLLWQANANDEIPLHIAARYGHTAVIKFLLERANSLLCQDLDIRFRSARKMLRMTNKEKDTALHEAVRYNHLEAAKLLMEEDPEFSYFANAARETPLYMAAERKLRSMVFEIINTCESRPAYNGPLGRTALHAAACWEEPEVIKLIQKIGGISKEADKKGWTPLHLAAHYNKNESTKLLLEYYRDVAYMKDREGRTALHIAAHRGHHMVMEKIISSCPDCCELVDNRGWNALHFAAEGPVLDDFEGDQHDIKLIIRAILDNRSLGNLLNQKDANGNTPLHHLLRRSSYWLDTNDNWHTNGIYNLFVDHRVDRMAFNNENLHAWEVALTAADVSTRKSLDILKEVSFTPNGRVPEVDEKIEKIKEEEEKKRKKAMEEEEEKRKEDAEKRNKDIVEKTDKEFYELQEDVRKAADTHLVVATLITTVTFAAGITMPGGFVGGDEKSQPAGSAILRRSAAFKAFVITDVLAMVLSSSAVFMYLFLAIIPRELKFYDARLLLQQLAFFILLFSMIPMVLAFITGTYAVLAHSLDVAIPACIIGLSFFPMAIFMFRKFWIETVGREHSLESGEK